MSNSDMGNNYSDSGFASGFTYAGFLSRLGAWIIDLTILFLVYLAVSTLLSSIISPMLASLISSVSGGPIPNEKINLSFALEFLQLHIDQEFDNAKYLINYLIYIANYLILDIISINFFNPFMIFFYFTLMESSSLQGTIGKQILSIKVVDKNGDRITFKIATIRFFSKYLSAIIFFIGYILVAFSEKKTALHDIIAGTYVIRNGATFELNS